jgi:cbb3-type cytochrome oxidase maturation protein
MSIALLLIPLALVLLGAAVAAFFWAVDNGQFEDLDEAARLVLSDEEPRGEQRPGRREPP